MAWNRIRAIRILFWATSIWVRVPLGWGGSNFNGMVSISRQTRVDWNRFWTTWNRFRASHKYRNLQLLCTHTKIQQETGVYCRYSGLHTCLNCTKNEDLSFPFSWCVVLGPLAFPLLFAKGASFWAVCVTVCFLSPSLSMLLYQQTTPALLDIARQYGENSAVCGGSFVSGLFLCTSNSSDERDVKQVGLHMGPIETQLIPPFTELMPTTGSWVVA